MVDRIIARRTIGHGVLGPVPGALQGVGVDGFWGQTGERLHQVTTDAMALMRPPKRGIGFDPVRGLAKGSNEGQVGACHRRSMPTD